jgi:hypothetical protein
MGDAGRLQCASYTHARRHPMVLGRIAGWAPPFQLTITQVLVVLGTFMFVTWSWSLWAPHLPATISFLAAAGAPIAAAWAVRHLRLEGRSLARTALGYLTLLSMPRAGRVGGRPLRTGRAVHTGATVWISVGLEP